MCHNMKKKKGLLFWLDETLMRGKRKQTPELDLTARRQPMSVFLEGEGSIPPLVRAYPIEFSLVFSLGKRAAKLTNSDVVDSKPSLNLCY